MTLMLTAASIKVMDALFGFLARNDAECYKRELLGRSWRRDWGMRHEPPRTNTPPETDETKFAMHRVARRPQHAAPG